MANIPTDSNATTNYGGLSPEFRSYSSQKCFVGHTRQAAWTPDIVAAFDAVLREFGLEPWYADDHFTPTKTLRDKVVEMIANARFGAYDVSSWRKDIYTTWQLPRNVLIELGMAIALNRPTLLIHHVSSDAPPLPSIFSGTSAIEFEGKVTLKAALEERLPKWVDISPDQSWLNRYCIFGNRACTFRSEHPRATQWGKSKLVGYVSDGLDTDNPHFRKGQRNELRGAFQEVLSRFNELEVVYLDALPPTADYPFMLCSFCQTVRSYPFAIYRLDQDTPAEVFITIGMSIAIETLFEYEIPKVFIVSSASDLPSLLRGYDVIEAENSIELVRNLKSKLPAIIRQVRSTAWKARPLPFVDDFPQQDASEPSPDIPRNRTKYRILVIDDNMDWQNVLKESLGGGTRGESIEIHVASTVSAAIDQIRNLKFDLLVVDISLEEADANDRGGLQLLQRLRSGGNNLPAIILTAYATAANVKQALRELGAVDFIFKQDFDPAEFQQTVLNALGIVTTRQPFDGDKFRDAIERIAPSDLERILNEILKWARSVTRAGEGSILLLSKDGSSLEIRASTAEDNSGRSFFLGEGITGHVAQTGRTYVVDDVTKDARYISMIPSTVSEIAIPFIFEGQILGVLNLESHMIAAFDSQDEVHLNELASIAASYIVRALRSQAGQEDESYIAFISYARQDEVFTTKLHADLVGRGFRLWFDKQQISLGESIQDKVTSGLSRSRKLILVLSEFSIRSRGVIAEFESALRLSELSSGFVVPLLVDDAALATNAKWVQELLANIQYLDFREWRNAPSYQRALEKLITVLQDQFDQTVDFAREEETEAGVISSPLDNQLLAKPIGDFSAQDTYELLRLLETELRNFILSELSKRSRNWWEQRVPEDIRRKSEERKQERENPSLGSSTDNLSPYEYLDFSDYVKVITMETNWEEVFKSVFGGQDVIRVKLNEISVGRNDIVHMREIPSQERELFVTDARQLLRAIYGHPPGTG